MKKQTGFSPFLPRRALISVADKRGIIEVAKALAQHGVELLATGNTASFLKKEGLTVLEVSEYTDFPEMLDGRVKTLHPAIHAGLLARGKQDEQVLAEQGFSPIDLLIVNLYPFVQVISQPDCDFNTAIEHIDIGGPAMLRSAAKNHAHTYVVVSPDDYQELLGYLNDQKAPNHWPFSLAKKAFAHTSAYDAAITNYLTTLDEELNPNSFPEIFTCQFHKKSDLRYGENPHQQAVFYADKHAASGSIGFATLVQGKPLSYNNILDANAALDCVKSFTKEIPLCVIVKHATPCGIAQNDCLLDAYLSAFSCDPNSAYGGIIAFNQPLDDLTATAILEKQFVEVIAAPAVSETAKQIIGRKENIRLLVTGDWPEGDAFRLDMRKVDGGLLVQEYDAFALEAGEFTPVTHLKPSQKQMEDLTFAWLAVKHLKSNAIVFAKNVTTIGLGSGQTSRVMSARIGLWQAEAMGVSAKDAVMASDAFIPFSDVVELAAAAGISAIIQPGGSIRDEEIIACANQYGIAMVFTGRRHFKH